MTNDMGLLSGILYFLAGSAASASSGKKTPIEQIRKERVELSNGSWNDTLRKELQMINTYDCRNQLSSVQYYIKKAQEDARFNNGTFEMDSDVLKRYQELLAENNRQSMVRVEQEKKKAEIKADKERKIAEAIVSQENQPRQESEHESKNNEIINETQQFIIGLLNKVGFSDSQIRFGENKKSVQIDTFSPSGNEIGILINCNEPNIEDDIFFWDIADFIEALVHISCTIPDSKFEQYMLSKGYSFEKFYYTSSKIRGYVTKGSVRYSLQYSGLDIQEIIVIAEESNSVPDSKEIDFDSMDGWQFESFCAEILEKNGYIDVTVTSGSGDQGVDVIAYRDGIKYGIQCKCYSNDIGNKAVQEIYAGKTFYNCHVGIVLTNRFFTPAAIELAKTSGIILWDRSKLLELIKQSGIEE